MIGLQSLFYISKILEINLIIVRARLSPQRLGHTHSLLTIQKSGSLDGAVYIVLNPTEPE
jgi:hypothetical protein